MNEIEKIARRLVRKCVSEVDGNFWFDRTKAAAIIKEVLAAATKRAEDLQAHYDRDTAKLQQEIARLTAANGGNYWRWQGDGGDYLESLTCPILIDVGQLHEILSVNRDAVVRAEEAEQSFATRVKEYREKVEQLEADKAFYHDKWLNALERLKAAEQEDARLREGIEATINYVRTGVHCRMIDHKMDSCDCEKICDEFAALLAQPKGGPDA